MKTPVILAAALTVVALAAPPASANDDDVAGSTECSSDRIKAKLKAGPRDDRWIKTNVQIDDVGRVRRSWTITVTDGGQTRTRTVRTAGRTNSLDADFFTADNEGADTVTFTATRSGASCSGTVTVG